MKKIIFLIPASLFSLILFAQPPAGDASKGTNYGEKVTVADVITADKLIEVLAKNDSKDKEPGNVNVKGEVIEVCKAEGCWLRMKTKDGTMLVKMKDHAFLVPLALNGKTVVVSGTATLKETSVKTLRHYAEDAGKSKEEIEAITKPENQPVLIATGLVVL